MGGYKGEGKHTYKSKLLVTSHVRKMVVVVVVVLVVLVVLVIFIPSSRFCGPQGEARELS